MTPTRFFLYCALTGAALIAATSVALAVWDWAAAALYETETA